MPVNLAKNLPADTFAFPVPIGTVVRLTVRGLRYRAYITGVITRNNSHTYEVRSIVSGRKLVVNPPVRDGDFSIDTDTRVSNLTEEAFGWLNDCGIFHGDDAAWAMRLVDRNHDGRLAGFITNLFN